MDAGYDIPSIARDLDWIAVMTYDYHGHWDKKTGHVSPMYAHPEDDYDYFNTVSCIFFYHHFNVIRDQKCQRIKILSGTLILSKQILHLFNVHGFRYPEDDYDYFNAHCMSPFCRI